ncbi:MAG: Cof-type HAD-IIB family hydrolase [Candidatus Gastranaerophilales bacterium]|nr:Cof-type HAD-IIB family hydrolase [Candidatus Gastranaerophilales bacterium]
MNNIKLIVLDIDGTLMDKNFHISDGVKNVISKAISKDIKVVLATGRMHSATVPIAKKLGITTPLITYQGAMIREYLNSDKILFHEPVEDKFSRKIIAELRQKDVQINVYMDDILFVETEGAILKEYANKRFISYKKVNSFDKVEKIEATKILAMAKTSQYADDLTDYLNQKYSQDLYITKSMPEYCEIADNKVSKGKAILYLANLWNINKSQIMAAGDGENDIEMLKIAGLSVVMGNASNKVKQNADFITDTVDNDGIVTAIEKFAL